ncbi:helix-turn-helix domain-containing protein [Alicyclobacillus suci]|uniref:helix-turn-helix domain-containing protein n=1 Tax=Alicyclobacillus suci TaxID=2816080 RepID=UPI001EEA8F04|nr:helix-turn-helix domain-containing protein [Alicyclobacillus suci]
MARYQKAPAKAFAKIHAALMEHAYKFGPDELALLDMFGEILADMSPEDFTDAPLTGQYLHAYYTQNNLLDNVLSAEEAAERWGLSPGYIKNLCARGKVKAKKLGKTWAIDGTQPNPRTSGDEQMDGTDNA